MLDVDRSIIAPTIGQKVIHTMYQKVMYGIGQLLIP